MSLPQGTIDKYIARTLTAEEQAGTSGVAPRRSAEEIREELLRTSLQDALDRDDKHAAIRFTYELLQDDEDDEKIDQLHEFLLTRVGVHQRDPFFSMSLQPVVQWCSGLFVSIPLILMVAHLLAPVQSPAAEQTDVLSCLGAALFFGVPLWDVLFSAAYNRVNRHRLIQPSVVR